LIKNNKIIYKNITINIKNIMELKGKEIINKIVSLWTNKYLYLTTFINKNDETYNYICEFSRPLPGKPNPEFTVKVYFFIEFNKEPVQYEDQ
jgi:hypothetical protein